MATKNLQELLDAAVLQAASRSGTTSEKIASAEEYFFASLEAEQGIGLNPKASFTVAADGTLDGTASIETPLALSSVLLDGPLVSTVRSAATSAPVATAGPCITVLANVSQALTVNSGVNLQAPNCEVHVHSTQNPAWIMNSGSTLNVAKVCMKGTQFIRNGGTVGPIQTNCPVPADPYFRKLTEPTVPTTCTTSGVYNPGTYTMRAGRHCAPTFNGSVVLNFEPGLHIITGTMIVNSGSTINAPGVTFYFPNSDSQILANGALTMNASAPTSGAYAGTLMFERTSDATNNSRKRQYIFNSSNGENLQGLIYLPNRNVTYNSTTNVNANTTQIYVNTMIINSANWRMQSAGASSSTPVKVRLLR